MNARGSHIGLLLRDRDGSVRFLHLAWHKQLELDSGIRNFYAWANCNEFDDDDDDATGRDIASWMIKVGNINRGRIPYGIKYWPGACFDDAANFSPSVEDIGLTCATFVMAMFESQSETIIDTANWPSRPGDKDWAAHIIDDLSCTGNSEHADIQAKSLENAVRFKPLEVAAAAIVYRGVASAQHQLINFADYLENQLKSRSTDAQESPMQFST